MKSNPFASTSTAAALAVACLGLAGCATTKPVQPIDMTNTTAATVPVAPPPVAASVPVETKALPVAPATNRAVGVLNADAPRVDATLSDGQVAAIASTVDKAEIDAATVALERADRVEVKRYAQRLLTVHANAESKIRAVVDNQNLILTGSPAGDSAMRTGAADVEALKAVGSREFDASFLAGRVKDQQRVLTLLDDTLIPDALNPLLKDALVGCRVEVARNIDLAKHELATIPGQ